MIVITKTDLVEPEFVELVAEDVKELVQETFLENAPIVHKRMAAGWNKR